MKKILAITLLFALSSFQAHAVTRLYDRNAGDIIDADRDDAEWDNTNNAINTHEALTSAHGVTGNIVGTAGAQTLTGPKTLTNPVISGGTIDGVTIGGTVAPDGAFGIISAANFTTNLLVASTIKGGILNAGEAVNCGISVSGSTLTIASADGSALSGSNPCFVGIKSSTAGQTTVATFTANVTFTFGAGSDTDGNLFGISEADWSSSMPFFIGVVYNGSIPYFTISRVPSRVSGGATTDFCQRGDTDCDLQTDVMFLTTGSTLTSFTNRPITQIGWFQMTYATSGNAWTATTSATAGTGFNSDYESVLWALPTGQMGAGSGSLILPAGVGTAPTMSSSLSYYKIQRSGLVTSSFLISGDAGTDGSGAEVLTLAIPYMYGAFTVTGGALGTLRVAEPTNTLYMGNVSLANNGVIFESALTGTGLFSDFTNGSRSIVGSFWYNASL